MEAGLNRILRRVAPLLVLFGSVAAVAPANVAGTSRRSVDARFEALVTAAKADMMVDPQRAVERAQQADMLALHAATAARGDEMRATTLWLRGEARARLDDPKQALALLRRADAIATRVAPGSLLGADVALSLGSAQNDLGKVTDALSTFQRAHRAYERLGQARGQAKALVSIALLYQSAGDSVSALRYFQQALDTHVADNAIAIALYNGRADALSDLGRFTEAEQSLERVVAIAREMRSDALEALALGNLARAELRAGHIDAAEGSIQRGMTLTSRPGAQASRPAMLMLAARAQLLRGHPDRAEALIAERFRGVDLTTTTLLNDRDAHEVAYNTYRALSRAPEALVHLIALKRLDDQATEIARSASAALASARFDYANQELRIAKLKADDLTKSVAFERSAARTQRFIFLGAAAATLLIIGLLAIGVFTLRRSRNQTRAINADLETSNAALGKALAAKTEFLATTSHEIRTPLNGILGMTQVMAIDPRLDETTRDRIAVVHGAGVTMRALVDDILDVAKIESGRMSVESVPLDLAVTVADSARMWREQAEAKGLAFTVSPCASLPTMGDPSRVRQIVFNLLSNAVKFTPNGRVTLTCSSGDGRVRVVVADTGIGIDPSMHEEIFQSFRQADTTTTRNFGGTGLGLSICRNLARAMGGDVTVESRLGEGATFTLDLPLIAVEQENETSAPYAVLVLERNPIARATLRSLLSPHGAVAFAESLTDARTIAADTMLIDYVSADEDADAIAALANAISVPLFLLVPADTALPSLPASVTVLQRPIGKRDLVARLFQPPVGLVRDAA